MPDFTTDNIDLGKGLAQVLDSLRHTPHIRILHVDSWSCRHRRYN